jgi:hypothetical protein
MFSVVSAVDDEDVHLTTPLHLCPLAAAAPAAAGRKKKKLRYQHACLTGHDDDDYDDDDDDNDNDIHGNAVTATDDAYSTNRGVSSKSAKIVNKKSALVTGGEKTHNQLILDFAKTTVMPVEEELAKCGAFPDPDNLPADFYMLDNGLLIVCAEEPTGELLEDLSQYFSAMLADPKIVDAVIGELHAECSLDGEGDLHEWRRQGMGNIIQLGAPLRNATKEATPGLFGLRTSMEDSTQDIEDFDIDHASRACVMSLPSSSTAEVMLRTHQDYKGKVDVDDGPSGAAGQVNMHASDGWSFAVYVPHVENGRRRSRPVPFAIAYPPKENALLVTYARCPGVMWYHAVLGARSVSHNFIMDFRVRHTSTQKHVPILDIATMPEIIQKLVW